MRTLRWIALALSCVLVAVTSAPARTVTIQTAASFAEDNPEAIERALLAALEASLRAARAMGLSSITMSQATLLDEQVIVLIRASDEDTD